MSYGKTLQEIKALRLTQESGLHKNPNPMIMADMPHLEEAVASAELANGDAGESVSLKLKKRVATGQVEKPLEKKSRKSSKKK